MNPPAPTAHPYPPHLVASAITFLSRHFEGESPLLTDDGGLQAQLVEAAMYIITGAAWVQPPPPPIYVHP